MPQTTGTTLSCFSPPFYCPLESVSPHPRSPPPYPLIPPSSVTRPRTKKAPWRSITRGLTIVNGPDTRRTLESLAHVRQLGRPGRALRGRKVSSLPPARPVRCRTTNHSRDTPPTRFVLKTQDRVTCATAFCCGTTLARCALMKWSVWLRQSFLDPIEKIVAYSITVIVPLLKGSKPVLSTRHAFDPYKTLPPFPLIRGVSHYY